ncbi:hypothetical protein SGPA1_11777 [Streptomyces misionensis JCM 4497]
MGRQGRAGRLRWALAAVPLSRDWRRLRGRETHNDHGLRFRRSSRPAERRQAVQLLTGELVERHAAQTRRPRPQRFRW